MTLWIDARFDGFIVFLRPTRRCVEITLYVPKESRISPNIPILKHGILLRSTILRIFREGSGFLGITPLTQASRPLVEVQICPYRPLGKGLNPKVFFLNLPNSDIWFSFCVATCVRSRYLTSLLQGCYQDFSYNQTKQKNPHRVWIFVSNLPNQFHQGASRS